MVDGNNTVTRPIDKLIEGLCDSIAGLRERCRALEALAQSRGDDAASAQLVLRQTLAALHREQLSHAKLQERYDRLVTEYREHRARHLPAAERRVA